jgi:arsenical-resistance protein 2
MLSFDSNFFCSPRRGSSKGRGTRGAAWFADYLEDQGNKDIQSLVLAEGIKGWVGAGPEYTDLMLEFNSKVWERS